MKSAREIRHDMEYGAVRGALALAGSLPIGMARTMGASLGSLAFGLGVRRDVSVSNITAALGVSEPEAVRIARHSYQNLGRCMMEFAAFRRWSTEDVGRLVHVDGLEHLDAARGAGRGAICVAGHLGNWELAGSVPVDHGHPVNFLVGEQTNSRVDTVMNDLRRARGVAIITRTSALKKVLQALRNNELVALLADQDARKGGVIVDFLGRPASTVRGPAMFAIRANCPILPFSIHREGKGHRAIYETPIWPDPSQDEETAVLTLTRHFTDRLSARIREHPEEYFWPHRRWKTAASQLTKSQAIEPAA